MKLMTKEIERKLTPRGDTDPTMDSPVIVKYFNPCGSGTWLITNGEQQENGDWLLYGYAHIHCWEWGYILLSELASIRTWPFGLRIERDLYCQGQTVRQLAEQVG